MKEKLKLTEQQAVDIVERAMDRCDCIPGVHKCRRCDEMRQLRGDLKILHASHRRLPRVARFAERMRQTFLRNA